MCVCVFSQLFQALGHFITKPIITQLSVSLIRGEDTGALNSYKCLASFHITSAGTARL